jgi:hypothetical protein
MLLNLTAQDQMCLDPTSPLFPQPLPPPQMDPLYTYCLHSVELRPGYVVLSVKSIAKSFPKSCSSSISSKQPLPLS